jgi:excisionase family DNA binding protein
MRYALRWKADAMLDLAEPLRWSLPDPRERPLLTVAEAATWLGWKRSTTYDAVHRGELPILRIGRRVFVKTAALAALVGLEGGDRAPTP